MTTDRAEIMEFIPHRGNMLLVDEIREHSETEGVGIHYVKGDAFWADGHFPGYPVMPGILQVEALAQVACFVVTKEIVRKGGEKKIGYFTTMEKIKFFKKVFPGDVLELHVEEISQKMGLHKFQGAAFVGEEKVCEAKFSAIIGKKDF